MVKTVEHTPQSDDSYLNYFFASYTTWVRRWGRDWWIIVGLSSRTARADIRYGVRVPQRVCLQEELDALEQTRCRIIRKNYARFVQLGVQKNDPGSSKSNSLR